MQTEVIKIWRQRCLRVQLDGTRIGQELYFIISHHQWLEQYIALFFLSFFIRCTDQVDDIKNISGKDDTVWEQ